MSKILKHRFRYFEVPDHQKKLSAIKRGLEKESLRIAPDGQLAQTAHPKAFGASHTHPMITTDYSEALLEFVTLPSDDLYEPVRSLENIHAFVYQNLGNELLWTNSMPCKLPADSEIPIAEYGDSYFGQVKHIYRRGLGHRYGRAMQTIAGAHFNFSLPDAIWTDLQTLEKDTSALADYRSDQYFHIIRNYLRYAWVMPYLFGASPAVCHSFAPARVRGFSSFGNHTYYLPYATSLRLSDIGYQNTHQQDLPIRYDSLNAYLSGMVKVLNHTVPEFSQIGIVDKGEYRQLNDKTLQIEAEFYAAIRPKRALERPERVVNSLFRQGVEYLEVRAFDLDPFEKVGISQDHIQWMDCLMLHGLLHDSPIISVEEQALFEHNLREVIFRGRDPELKLMDHGHGATVFEMGSKLVSEMRPIADWLSFANPNADYHETLDKMLARFEQPETLPSARVLASLGADRPFFDFGLQYARETADLFRGTGNDAELAKLARESIARFEDEDDSAYASFEAYLAQYLKIDTEVQALCKAPSELAS